MKPSLWGICENILAQCNFVLFFGRSANNLMNVTPACDFLSGIRLCLPSFEGMDGYSFRFSILFDSPSWLLIRSVQSRLNLETYAVVASTQIQHTSLSRSDSFQLLYKALDCRQSIANPLVPWQCEDTNCSYVISKYYLNEERCL